MLNSFRYMMLYNCYIDYSPTFKKVIPLKLIFLSRITGETSLIAGVLPCLVSKATSLFSVMGVHDNHLLCANSNMNRHMLCVITLVFDFFSTASQLDLVYLSPFSLAYQFSYFGAGYV